MGMFVLFVFFFGYKRKYILCLISTLVLSPSLKRWESSVSEILNETVSLSFFLSFIQIQHLIFCDDSISKIQTLFFQARKALRALKGLVKIQALVRGFLVRKRAAATLHSMQALIRAQAAVRSQRARRSITKENRFRPEFRARKSMVIPFFSPSTYFKIII